MATWWDDNDYAYRQFGFTIEPINNGFIILAGDRKLYCRDRGEVSAAFMSFLKETDFDKALKNDED